MKKTIALCLAGAMGLAACGLAACGESGGGSGATPADPEAVVSDKIETDEQWDKAMRDTFTYLFDFEGEDDAAKTYEQFPYWHPEGRFDQQYHRDLKLAQDRNFKVDYFMDVTYPEELGYNELNCSFTYDMGRYYSLYGQVDEEYDEKIVVKFEEYMKYGEAGELMCVGKITEDEGPYTQGDPLNVWSNQLHYHSVGVLNSIPSFFDYSHFGLLKEHGETYFEEHPSVLEFAKYDEEQGGYVITDKELLSNVNGGNLGALGGLGSADEATVTFKFKDGMLVAAWMELTDERTGVVKEGFSITYGGQSVTFPSDLPW